MSKMTISTPTYLTIPTKSSAPISYSFFPSIFTSQSTFSSPQSLIIFLNGLGLPASSWTPSITLLRSTLTSCPAILTYDRFGQGLTTARDPKGEHDFMDVVEDLHEIVITVAASELGLEMKDVEIRKLGLMLVGASIGAPVARLYAHFHPGKVAALILLNSNIANVNYSDIWPNPSSPSFDPSSVISSDCPTMSDYIIHRNKLTAMFDLHVKNAEELDRTTSPKLLPSATSPRLTGPEGKGPWLSVVGHDPETFAMQSLEGMGTPLSLSNKFTNAYWAKYNQELIHITDEDRCPGVVIAKKCGHFIRRDDPQFVADEVGRMILKLGWGVAALWHNS